MNAPASPNRRILVVDDNRAIHQDFLKILCPDMEDDAPLDAMESRIFGHVQPPPSEPGFEVHSAFQGEEAIERVRSARQQGWPYALAFVDIRMPPGLNGVETTARLWKEDPDLQVVICSAYADYSWEEMTQRLGRSQRLLILRKPFDDIEVRQLADALTEKWELLRSDALHLEELNRAVEERTRQLTAATARLVQSQRLEALGRLSAGLSHEINNPLSFILSNLAYLRSALQAEPTPSPQEMPELREVCAESLEGAERILHIMRDIRRFSGLGEETRTRLEVHERLERALAEARPWLGLDIQIVREFQKVPVLLATEEGLHQFFLGLLAHAAQSLQGSSHPRCLRLATWLQEDGRVAIEVQDNGRGIAPEHLGHLFEPFYASERLGSPSGLGLSVCYGIILGLGGDLVVDSAPGKGTTFRVLLPHAPMDASLEVAR